MKRLIRKSDKIKQEIITPEIPLVDKDTIKNLKEDVINDIKNINTSNMVLLNELDEADIRHNKCPNCKSNNLINKKGFKICTKCLSIYKVFDGKSYYVKE